MSDFSNKLTPNQIERLALLSEECGEVIQIIGKILRHGYRSGNPDSDSGETNIDLLEKEIGHLNFASTLVGYNDLDFVAIFDYATTKKLNADKWLHCSHSYPERSTMYISNVTILGPKQ